MNKILSSVYDFSETVSNRVAKNLKNLSTFFSGHSYSKGKGQQDQKLVELVKFDEKTQEGESFLQRRVVLLKKGVEKLTSLTSVPNIVKLVIGASIVAGFAWIIKNSMMTPYGKEMTNFSEGETKIPRPPLVEDQKPLLKLSPPSSNNSGQRPSPFDPPTYLSILNDNQFTPLTSNSTPKINNSSMSNSKDNFSLVNKTTDSWTRMLPVYLIISAIFLVVLVLKLCKKPPLKAFQIEEPVKQIKKTKKSLSENKENNSLTYNQAMKGKATFAAYLDFCENNKKKISECQSFVKGYEECQKLLRSNNRKGPEFKEALNSFDHYFPIFFEKDPDQALADLDKIAFDLPRSCGKNTDLLTSGENIVLYLKNKSRDERVKKFFTDYYYNKSSKDGNGAIRLKIGDIVKDIFNEIKTEGDEADFVQYFFLIPEQSGEIFHMGQLRALFDTETKKEDRSKKISHLFNCIKKYCEEANLKKININVKILTTLQKLIIENRCSYEIVRDLGFFWLKTDFKQKFLHDYQQLLRECLLKKGYASVSSFFEAYSWFLLQENSLLLPLVKKTLKEEIDKCSPELIIKHLSSNCVGEALLKELEEWLPSKVLKNMEEWEKLQNYSLNYSTNTYKLFKQLQEIVENNQNKKKSSIEYIKRN